MLAAGLAYVVTWVGSNIATKPFSWVALAAVHQLLEKYRKRGKFIYQIRHELNANPFYLGSDFIIALRAA